MKKANEAIALERIESLFAMARTVFRNDATKASRYIDLARKIAAKARIRIPSKYRRQFCRNCERFLMPGVNCRVRVTGKTITYYCMECRHFKRIGYKS